MSCNLKISGISAKINDRTLFENLNLELSHKQKIAIIGPNGCGKTTMLEILGGLREPNSGQIEIFHHNIANLGEFAKFRREIGYLFQNSQEQFICPKVFDDVAFGLFARNETLKKERKNLSDESELDKHLRQHHFLKREILSKDEINSKTLETLENLGILHLKDEIVFHLSGGEAKLVALAGILVCEPQIILLDEPTTGLDEKMQENLAKILANLDLSQIIVSHDKEFIESVADEIYYLTPTGLCK